MEDITHYSIVSIVLTFTIMLMLIPTPTPYPQDWICKNRAYSIHNLHTGEYVLHIKNVTANISIAPTSNKSFSMAPTMGANTELLILEIENKSLIEVGDIITFVKDGCHIVHRVVSKGYDKEGLYFITKGDHNLVPDGKIREEQVTGVVVGIIY